MQNQGIEVAIITGRQSNIVQLRANELSIRHLIQGREDKLIALNELLSITGIPKEQTAYMGDDLPDLSAIENVRLGATVANANTEVKAIADWISKKDGGDGAVRELAELILCANDLYDKSIDTFRSKN